jgi:hypothetical protein
VCNNKWAGVNDNLAHKKKKKKRNCANVAEVKSIEKHLLNIRCNWKSNTSKI